MQCDFYVPGTGMSATNWHNGIGNIPWDFGWSGYLVLTTDYLPQILRVDDDYYAGVLYNRFLDTVERLR